MWARLKISKPKQFLLAGSTMLVGHRQTCGDSATNVVKLWRVDGGGCQTACFKPVSLLHYSHPPVTPCYKRKSTLLQNEIGLDFTRLLSALTVQPSAAQLRVIRNACSCRAPHQPISWPPGAGCWLGEATLWWRGCWLMQGTVCCRNTVMSNV